ncbi:transposase [Microbulbifer litoralis]|uniref:transposase n=1 Tax=Microbulbifer litoralis TaxID=2933965 RepID=UPI002027C7B6|nr:transposase [Microbulbifer sp. GX H0434]
MNSFSSKDAELGLGAPKGWYSRGYVPHFDHFCALQSITFRLADSLPQGKLEQLSQELRQENLPDSRKGLEKRKRIEQWLDAGYGCCALGHPMVAKVVQDALLKFNGVRYLLTARNIMPNHVHVLIDPKDSLARIVQSWKSFTGRWALSKNAELAAGAPELRVPGRQFWMRDYWDRYIRDQEYFERVLDYIHRNPVKAGLCSRPEEWQWSSAWVRQAPAWQQPQQEKTP